MIIEREIPKRPDIPKLEYEAIRLINELCFDVPDQLTEPCEAVLIFGTSIVQNYSRIRSVFNLVKGTIGTNLVYISGGKQRMNGPIEADEIHRNLCDHRLSGIEFRLDRNSNNTRDNVLGAMDMGLGDHKNILFIAKTAHCGRCKLTLMKYLPKTKIRHRGYDFMINESEHFRDEWHKSDSLSRLMWGEFLRIELYGSRGDIAYPRHIAEKVRRVRELTVYK